VYDSGLNEYPMEDLLERSSERDRVMQYTTEGIHKDDLEIRVNGFPLRRYASQGQQKSILIALKLAQFDVMAELKGIKPLLLLDDIFEKLDQERITALMTLVSQQHFGQIFITDSHPERVTDILGSIDCPYDRFSIELLQQTNQD
jgi:DNA replication and repair protein RecF